MSFYPFWKILYLVLNVFYVFEEWPGTKRTKAKLQTTKRPVTKHPYDQFIIFKILKVKTSITLLLHTHFIKINLEIFVGFLSSKDIQSRRRLMSVKDETILALLSNNYHTCFAGEGTAKDSCSC